MARPSSLKIVNWNGRSVQNKHLEFFDFAQRQSIDVAVITETWLQPNINFIHPNYYCVRHDRPSCTEAGRGGGVLIAVRKGIQFHQQNISTKTIEAAEITIPSGDNYISIIAAYFPGGRRCADWSQFRRDIRDMVARDNPFFVVGDFNARNRLWNCENNNRAGNILLQEAACSGFTILFPDSPTFLPSGRGKPSTLDLVLSNNIIDMSKPIVVNDLSSDHLPVIFDIKPTTAATSPTNTVSCYARANWVTFQRAVNAKLDPTDPLFTDIQDGNGVNAALALFKIALLEAESVAVPQVVPRQYEIAQITDETKQLIRLRNTRRRQWMRTRDPLLKEIVSSLNNRIRDDCTNARYSKFSEALSSMERGDNKIWRITKALKKTVKYSPPLRNGDNLCASPQEKAKLLADCFAKAHNNQSVVDRETTDAVKRSIDLIEQSVPAADNSWIVRPKEISNIIRSLKVKKTLGHDGIEKLFA